MSASDFLIYGLIDPRTLLIRYVGLSSSGMKRPKNHRKQSCPDTYCRRWVRALQREGLDFEIVVLEIVREETELAEAERWWIAFGRACGWPLTNCTAGGSASLEAILERRRRRAEWEDADAKRLRAFYWARASYNRGKQALEKDRQKLQQRLAAPTGPTDSVTGIEGCFATRVPIATENASGTLGACLPTVGQQLLARRLNRHTNCSISVP